MTPTEYKLRRERAEKHDNAWLDAELAVSTSQSYSIGSRSLTRANLGEIRKQLDYWRKEIEKLDNLANHKGRNRIYRAVPRDL